MAEVAEALRDINGTLCWGVFWFCFFTIAASGK